MSRMFVYMHWTEKILALAQLKFRFEECKKIDVESMVTWVLLICFLLSTVLIFGHVGDDLFDELTDKDRHKIELP